MGLDAHEDGLTAQQIVRQAEALHDYPGKNITDGGVVDDITAPAYVALNEILTSLYTQRDWPFLASAQNVVIAAQENALPPDYWRARFVNPLILIDGINRIPLRMLDPATFFQRGLDATSTSGTPAYASIDKRRGSFYVDCVPARTFNAELHYFRYVARLTTIAQVPVYPDSQHCVQLLNAWYAQQQNDPERYQMAKAEAAEAEARIRASVWEATDDDNTLLDPRVFRTPRYDDW